jgi:putative ABC transport system permease protein
MSSPSNRGAIRPLAVVSEASRIALSTPVASLIIAVIVAAVCGVILVTTGQTVRAEQDVLGRIDDSGTRLVVAIDDQGSANIDPAAVERIAGLSNVEWVIGLGYAQDGRNANIGGAANPVPIRTLWGHIPNVIAVNGRTPDTNEGLAGSEATEALGMPIPIGGIDTDGTQIAIVGGFTASEPLTDLNRSIITPPQSNSTQKLRSVHVLATNPNEVANLTTAVAMLLAPDDPTGIRFETSQTLADVRAAVAGELGRYSRRLILGVLAAGLVLIALAIYSSVTLRRQDFGRRRALGATRTTIVALVATHYLIVAAIGTLIGVTTAAILTTRWNGLPPDAAFATATAILTLVATFFATIPPALIAAYRDPVRVLRIP